MTHSIFGRNFNGRDIPADLRRRFSAEKPIVQCACGVTRIDTTTPHLAIVHDDGNPEHEFVRVRGQRARLVGVALNSSALAMMLMQANNGHRILGYVEKRIGHNHTPHTSPMFVQSVYGIYAY
jgi:hypothetical protein